ncbi:hypothetical protein CPB86DRAFT_721454 [Serendipita vermifera]|nr:hypothetical protein CPB86DRAFT_721454 [Serendipita vermifera]
MPPPPATLPFPIPDSILLLLHLHLLQYPLDPEQCDPDMFKASSYGIGDRIKSMERIVYFLIGTAHGEAYVKKLLPMFPSKQPSETLAFRNAVTKYLETLRSTGLKASTSKDTTAKAATVAASTSASRVKKAPALKSSTPSSRPIPPTRSVSTASSSRTITSSGSSRQASSTRSASATVPKSNPTASDLRGSSVQRQDPKKHIGQQNSSASTVDFGWWWKDVPVRKSLLEECTGARFERLLLALSIHALFVCKFKNDSHPLPSTLQLPPYNASNLELFNTLSCQPEDYQSLVQRTHQVQERLKKDRDHLIQRRREAESLRNAFGNISSSNDQRDVAGLGTTRDELLQTLRQLSSSPETTAAPSLQEWHSWILSMMGLEKSKEQESTAESVNDISSAEKARTRRKTASRKTILPPDSLPKVAATYSNYLERLENLKEKLASIKDVSIQSQDETLAQRDKLTGLSQPLKAESTLFASAKEAEDLFSSLLEEFAKELSEADTLLDLETKMKKEALLSLYQESEDTIAGQATDHSAYYDFGLQVSDNDISFVEMIHQNLPLNRADIVESIRSSLPAIALNIEHGQEEEDEELELQDDDLLEDIEESDEELTIDQTMVMNDVPMTPSIIKQPATPPKSSRSKAFVTPGRSNIFGEYQPWAEAPRSSKRSLAKDIQRTPKTASSKIPLMTGFATGARMRTPNKTMATPSFFMTPGDNMEDLKDILPPFQSPWRSVTRSRMFNQPTPRKSGRISITKPRISGARRRLSKGQPGSSNSFVRTPLRSGKRLSNIVPPVNYTPSRALGPVTPRASLDDVFEEIVDDLLNEATTKTPPQSVTSQRLFDSRNNIQRESPFKSLMRSGRGPAAPRSPEITSDVDGSSPSTIRELSFTAHSAGVKGWEDLVGGHAATSKPPKSKAKRTSYEPFDGPSFTLHDILLKAGQDGVLGANGTFNLDLLDEAEIYGGDDSVVVDDEGL